MDDAEKGSKLLAAGWSVDEFGKWHNPAPVDAHYVYDLGTAWAAFTGGMPRCADCGATTPRPPDGARHLTPLCPVHYAVRCAGAGRATADAEAARGPDGAWWVRTWYTADDEYVSVQILWPASAVEQADQQGAVAPAFADLLRQAAADAAENNANRA